MLQDRIENLTKQAKTYLMIAKALREDNQGDWFKYTKLARKCVEKAVELEQRYNDQGVTACIENPLAA